VAHACSGAHARSEAYGDHGQPIRWTPSNAVPKRWRSRCFGGPKRSRKNHALPCEATAQAGAGALPLPCTFFRDVHDVE